MQIVRSPLARPFPALPAICRGDPACRTRALTRIGTGADLTFAELATGTSVAGVFTPKRLRFVRGSNSGANPSGQGRARALVVQCGQFQRLYRLSRTRGGGGHSGQVSDAWEAAEEVFVSSTGSYRRAAAEGQGARRRGSGAGGKALRMGRSGHAIGTTDTFPKGAGPAQWSAKHGWNWPGSVKGSGMIAPHIATMLGYVFTDADVAPPFCRKHSNAPTRRAFPASRSTAIPSTSDTCAGFRYRQGGNARIASWESPGADAFAAALEDVCRNLAQAVVRDGRGCAEIHHHPHKRRSE